MFAIGLCICMSDSRETLCPLYSDDRAQPLILAALHLVNVTNVCPL